MITNVDESRLKQIDTPAAGQDANDIPYYEPPLNPFLRCQMPANLVTDSDLLRQYYKMGVPQYRIIAGKI